MVKMSGPTKSAKEIKLERENTKKMKAWMAGFSKAVMNFESIIPHLRECITVTSENSTTKFRTSVEEHKSFARTSLDLPTTKHKTCSAPISQMGREIQDFLDNRALNLTENDAANFDLFFREELKEQKRLMNYCHETYKVPLCEVSGADVCKCRPEKPEDLTDFAQPSVFNSFK